MACFNKNILSSGSRMDQGGRLQTKMLPVQWLLLQQFQWEKTLPYEQGDGGK